MFAYRIICRQSPEHIDVKDFKLLKYSQVAELVDAGNNNTNIKIGLNAGSSPALTTNKLLTKNQKSWKIYHQTTRHHTKPYG